VVIPLEIATAIKIANPSIQAKLFLSSSATITSTTIDTTAATIKILSVKSSKDYMKISHKDFSFFLAFSLDPNAKTLASNSEA